MTMSRLRSSAVLIGILALLSMPGLWAETIRLDDKTTLKGRVFRMDDEEVIIGLPRESIATIDGKALPPVLGEGTPAPSFTVKDLAGASQTVGKRTGPVTMLHFWVNWCPHCRSDAPKVQALYNQFRDNPNVQLLTVNLDDDRKVVERFIKEHQVTYPVILAAEQAAAPDGIDLPALYQITGFPVTYLIDAKGIVRHKVSGSFVESGQDLGALISALLSPPPPSKPH